MAGGGQGNLAAHALALVVPAPSSAWFRRCASCQVFLCPPGVRTETLVAMLLVEDSVADHLMGVTEAFFPSWVSAASLQAILQPLRGPQYAGARLPSRHEVVWRLGTLGSSVLNAAAHRAPREPASHCLGPVPGAPNSSRKLELVGRKVNQQMVYRSLLCLLNAERGFRYG